MPISAFSQQWEAYFCYKLQNHFLAEKQKNYQPWGYQLFAAGAPWIWKSHIFCLKGTVQRKLRWVKSGINR
jgi:hypothetical protein